MSPTRRTKVLSCYSMLSCSSISLVGALQFAQSNGAK